MRPLPLVSSCLLCACAAPVEPIVDVEEPAPVVGVVGEHDLCEGSDEGGVCLGEAAEALAGGCYTMCAVANALGCGGVVGACLVGDVIGAGTLTIPCGFAIAAACWSAGSGGQCASLCGGAS